MIRTRILLQLVIIFAAITLSGCRVVVDTKVNQDGSGDLRTSIVFSAEEKQNFESSAGNAGKSICDNLKKDVPAEATFLQQDGANGETYCTTVRAFSTMKKLQGLYAGMGNVAVNELKLGSGTFVFDVQVDLRKRNGNEAVAQEWRLTIPGEIGDNNADMSEGSTLIWNIQPGQVRSLHAESKVGPDPLTWIILGGAIILLGIVIAVIFARSLAKRRVD
jgi:hypothetical protein